MRIHHPAAVRAVAFSPLSSQSRHVVAALDNGSIYRSAHIPKPFSQGTNAIPVTQMGSDNGSTRPTRPNTSRPLRSRFVSRLGTALHCFAWRCTCRPVGERKQLVWGPRCRLLRGHPPFRADRERLPELFGLGRRRPRVDRERRHGSVCQSMSFILSSPMSYIDVVAYPGVGSHPGGHPTQSAPPDVHAAHQLPGPSCAVPPGIRVRARNCVQRGLWDKHGVRPWYNVPRECGPYAGGRYSAWDRGAPWYQYQ